MSRLYVLFIFIIIFSFLQIFYIVLGDPIEDTQLSISSASQTVNAKENFTIDIYCVPGQAIKAFELRLSFDSTLIEANSVVEGNIFNNYSTFFNNGTIDNVAGTIVDIYGLIVGTGNVTDNGTFATISFTAQGYSGTSEIEFIDVGTWTGVANETDYVSIDVTSGSVEVVGGSSPPSPPPPPGGGGGFPPPPVGEENNAPIEPLEPSGPIFVEMGIEYTYSSSTFDEDGDQIRLKFDWGDGNFSNWSDFVDSNETISMSYNWTSISIYELRVIAQDTNGLNSSWSPALNVTVSQNGSGVPPVIIINLTGNISVNETIIFDATGSYDIDGYIISYHWDFGDGGTDSGLKPYHIYKHPGDYVVTLTVIDNYGNNYSKSIVVTIESDIAIVSEDKKLVLPFNLLMLIFGTGIAVIVVLTIFYKDQITLKYLNHQIRRIEKQKKKFMK